ncbi:MAG: VWA domain-containing protein [Maricaulaceae bacterium]
MSDELDKLAAELHGMRPSDTSRKKGMAAALSAFDEAFVANDIAETALQEAQDENILDTSQGLADPARPTGQSAGKGPVPTFGSRIMSKLRPIFTFNPKMAMMAGSCMAALIAAIIVMPQMDDLTQPTTADVVISDTPAVASEPSRSDTLAQARDVETQAVAQLKTITAPSTVGASNVGEDKPSAIAEPALTVTADVPAIKAPVVEPNVKREQIAVTGRRQLQDVLEARRAIDAIKASSLGEVPQVSLRESLTDIRQEAESATPATRNRAVNGFILEEVSAEYKVETKTLVTKEASSELVETPPNFETVTETVIVSPQSTELVVVPPTYEWVDGDIDGSSVEYETKPAEYETVSESVAVQEASTELVTIPAIYNSDGTIAVPASVQERTIPSVTKTETRRRIKTPASTIERVVPYEKRDGKTRVPVTTAKVTERVVPAVTKQVSRRVIKTPAASFERIVPAGTTVEVAVRTVVTPEKFYLRDEEGNVIREFENRDEFEQYKLNQVTSVQEKPVSTFSIDVDTASYSFLRASLNRGQLPPRSAIRLEEMINYFPYDYAAPTSADEPFKANVTVTPTPWNKDTKLMHIGIKGYVPPQDERPRSNIVFLIDTSGSMNRPNKLPLLINSFKLLLNTLDADDTVSIVTYAGSAGTVLEPTSASDKHAINEALTRLRAGGSTAGAAGLELAYQKAQESFDDEGVNRVILATDGDFNVGFSSHEDMKNFISEKRETGIFLSVLGFGMGNYNDQLMQSLSQNGNGVAAYIDNLSEANKVLANEAGSALITIAKDVKIQVEFNPDTISEYRLIGYETRALKRQDFNNDKVDAGEIGAGHSVTAIYELTPQGSPAQVIDDLRYASERSEATSSGSDEYAFVKIRHKLPTADTSTLQSFPVSEKQELNLRGADEDMRFAAAVAAFGQKLRGDTQLAGYSYDDVAKLAVSGKGMDDNGYRAEFIRLVRLVQTLSGE